MRLAIDGGSQSSEVGDTACVLNDDLPVDQRRSAAQLVAGVDHSLILVAPVQATAGERTGILASNFNERASMQLR